MADEINPEDVVATPTPVDGPGDGAPLTSVGRGTISINDHVGWVGDDGTTQMTGVVVGLIAPEAEGDIWQVNVLPDGGDAPQAMDPASVRKLKKSEIPENPQPLVEGETPAVVGPNSEAVAALLNRMAEELGFLQGPDGKFIGSEPDGGSKDGEGGDQAGGSAPDAATAFANTDNASVLDQAGGWDNWSQETQDAVESALSNGGYLEIPEGLSEDDYIAEAEAQGAALDAAFEPAPAAFTITTDSTSYGIQYDPESGTFQQLSTGLGSGTGLPQGTPVGEVSPAAAASGVGGDELIVGVGNPTEAIAGSIATNERTDWQGSVLGNVPVQISVPEGHPIINAGTGNINSSGAGPAASTTVGLSSQNTDITVTGMGIDPATGSPMIFATASAR